MSLVAGIDSSTQSCKVVIYDTESRQIVRQGVAKHPSGTEVDPAAWWQALQVAIQRAGGLDQVEALSVAGQQHGLICLDRHGQVIRPALLWNDTRSAQAAAELVEQCGAEFWARETGIVPVAAVTLAKLRWVAQHEPDNARRIAAICLPHDWLTWKLSGATSLDQLVTDRSDASGTGYVDCETAKYRRDLLALGLAPAIPDPAQALAAANAIVLPRIATPWEVVGETKQTFSCGVKLGPGAGDNAAAALGLDLQVGQASLSLGTSGVVAAVTQSPVRDASGLVNGFMDATGGWLPLACTLNGSRIVDAMARVLGVDYERFSELALAGPPGAGGLVLTPYFEGERTPNLPDATADLAGMTLANCTPEHVARATVEGMLNLMKGALNAVCAQGLQIDTIKLIGGGAKSVAVQALAEELLGVKVEIPTPAEYVALGAAKQAAKVLAGTK